MTIPIIWHCFCNFAFRNLIIKSSLKLNRNNMKELKCPKCGNVFTVDESDYADIANQVKNAEFEAEVA